MQAAMAHGAHAAMSGLPLNDPALQEALMMQQQQQHHDFDHQWAQDFVLHGHRHDAAMEAALAQHFEAAQHEQMMEAAMSEAAQRQAADWAAKFAASEEQANAAECSCAWVDQLQQQQAESGESWAEQFNRDGVQVFTCEGEPLKSVEEKTRESQFYGFMKQIADGEVEIVEPAKNAAAGSSGAVADPVKEAMDGMSAEFLNELANAAKPTSADEEEAAKNLRDYLAGEHDEGDVDDDEAAWMKGEADGAAESNEAWVKQYEAYKAQMEGHEGNMDEEAMQRAFDQDGDWLKEYQEMSKKMQAAQENCDYPFEENNPFLFHDRPMEEAVELIAMGTLSDAVLALEAACQKDPDNVQAWFKLGTTQAENEKDELAIRALNKARHLAPTNLDVYQALAVSHTNESNFTQALQSMRSWIVNHPAYASLPAAVKADAGAALMAPEDDDTYSSAFLAVSPTEHREVILLYQAAHEINPRDLDVVVGLGVLKHLGHDYDAASEYFRQAVAIRPDDPKLWNKLGATLANGQRNREAIAAYERALDINPGYVRSRYNMGIALSNLGEHKQAARHFLRAILMQEGSIRKPVGGAAGAAAEGFGPSSGGVGAGCPHRSTREIWDILRMSLNLMERPDLVEKSWNHDAMTFAEEFGIDDF